MAESPLWCQPTAEFWTKSFPLRAHVLYVAPLCLEFFCRHTEMPLNSSPESLAELLGIWLATLSRARGCTSGVSVRVSVIFRMEGEGP